MQENFVVPMKYVTTDLSSGQVLRFMNALDESLEKITHIVSPSNSVKSDLHDNCELEDIMLNSVFTENIYQDISGFKISLLRIDHKGLLKTFTSCETGEVLTTVVLIPAEICEN